MAGVFVIIFKITLVSAIISVLVEPSSRQATDGCQKLQLVLLRGTAHKGSQGKVWKAPAKIWFAAQILDEIDGPFRSDIYLTGFAKTWLKKFQVHFNNLTSNSK